jgi:hypothetical protein
MTTKATGLTQKAAPRDREILHELTPVPVRVLDGEGLAHVSGPV